MKLRIKEIKSRIFGDKDYLNKTYKRIQGSSNEEFANKIIEKNRKRQSTLLLIFLLFMMIEMVQTLLPGKSGFIYDNGTLVGIQRPDSEYSETFLIAEVQGENFSFKREVPLRIDSIENANKRETRGNDIEENKIMQHSIRLDGLVTQLNELEGDLIELPLILEENVSIRWKIHKENDMLLLLLLFVTGLGTLFATRYSKLKQMKLDATDSIYKELPEFINKIILLMNAGIVFTSAFNRIMESQFKEGKPEYFYGQLLNIYKKVGESNGSLIMELKEFAERSDVREFSRVINIMADNIYKGSTLIDKLQAESEQLWEMRKKKAEEKIRTGETKLAFPLALQLIVLIVITISPAMIGS